MDVLNHVNNVKYVQWVNDVAEAHWLQNASDSIKKKYFWVLISHTIDYKKSAYLKDEILVKTYVKNSEGVKSTRIVEIYNKNTQDILATSETKWCLLNTKTQKPTRITEELKTLFI